MRFETEGNAHDADGKGHPGRLLENGVQFATSS
jgi:hypothetical protein